jgi:trehalose 6-phosphate phosphatase
MRNALDHLSSIAGIVSRSERFLVATDFDGTLCPIADSPGVVGIPPEVLEVLGRLMRNERCVVAVLSGRPLNDLTGRVPFPVILSGNHGLEIRGPGFAFEHPEAERLRPDLEAACRILSATVSHWSGAWIEDKGLTATVHFRNVKDEAQRELVRAVRQSMGRFGRVFGMRAGKRTVEIHPRIGWDKGSALSWIRNELGMREASCLCLGDDRTDETMFIAHVDQINVRVGLTSRSAAQFYVEDPFEVAALLSGILNRTARRPAAPAHGIA